MRLRLSATLAAAALIAYYLWTDRPVPWWALALGAVTALATLTRAGALALSGIARAFATKDPLRMYPSPVRTKAFALAGGRCEYTSMWRRCTAPAEHADHYIPWSVGGATTLRNCVASCAHHNTSKGARILARSAARRLQRRRRGYFPQGVSVDVGETYTEAMGSSAPR